MSMTMSNIPIVPATVWWLKLLLNGWHISLQVNGRIKALKRQLDELEEEVSREKAQRRKVQRELEDLVADNESKEREITNLKNKLR